MAEKLQSESFVAFDFQPERFGMLTTVSSRYKPANAKRTLQDYVCDCGKNVTKRSADVVSGNTLSCGCLSSKTTSQRNSTHGMSGKSEYITWKGMKQRCCNVNNPSYSSYGGRGISICERWSDAKTGFANFLMDMGYKPSSNHSLDRIDNDGNYEPSNCTWATKTQQASNRRSNILFLHNGAAKTLKQISELESVCYKKLHHRVAKGFTIEESINLIRSKANASV